MPTVAFNIYCPRDCVSRKANVERNGNLPDLSIVDLLSVDVLVQRISNYYANYPTHRLYFGVVETVKVNKYTKISAH